MPRQINQLALLEIEEALAKGVRLDQLYAVCAEKHKFAERTTRRYADLVKKRWAAAGYRSQTDAALAIAARDALREGKITGALGAMDRIEAQRSRGIPEDLAKYAQAGAPPEDPLEGVRYGQKLLLIAMQEAATDPGLTRAERREELIRLSRAVANMVPESRILDAEDKIRRDASSMDDVRKGGPEPKNVEGRATRSLRAEEKGAR